MPSDAPRRMRFPLSAKIVLWLFLNLLLLALAAAVFARVQLGLGLDSFLAGSANRRLQEMAQVLVAQLSSRPRAEWDGILRGSASAYHVQLALFQNDGAVRLAGQTVPPPKKILDEISKGPPPGAADPPPPPRDAAPPRGDFRKAIFHTSDPALYWILIRVPVRSPGDAPPTRSTLLLASDSLSRGDLGFDFAPWILGAVSVFSFSVLLWIPLVRGVTRALKQMTRAAEDIAHGRFDTHLDAPRSDELGRLAAALNHMAGRLREFFTGQKRFLGDIAHELCSPLARMEMALGILEQRAAENQRAYVSDVREEARQMSALVNELLSFSKASLGGKNVVLAPVPLSELVRRVMDREAAGNASVSANVSESVAVLAEADLLARALANVLRNALRYAGDAGPIQIAARAVGSGHVILTISDHGRGVPEETLHRLFDPFFRPENARARETGGTGLGLAIVKSCVEACGGSVSARNREPAGLQVEIRLQRA